MRRPAFSPRSLLLLFALLLAACGGGGTGGPLDGGDTGGGGGGGGTTGQPTFSAQGPGGAALNSIALSFDEVTEITLRLTDGSGTGLASQPLTYSLDVPAAVGKGSAPVAEKVIASGTATTNANGFATISLVLSDPAATGTGVLTVTATQLGETQTFNISVDAAAGVPAELSISLIDPGTGAPVNGVDPNNGVVLSILLTDAAGNPVTEPSVIAVSELDNIGEFAGLSDAGLVTTVNGEAFVSFAAGQSTPAGALQFQASTQVVRADEQDVSLVTAIEVSRFLTSSGGGSSSSAVNFTPAPYFQNPPNPAGLFPNEIRPETPGVLLITLVDENGDPVAGQLVNVSTTLGQLIPGSGNVATNNNGEATIQVAAGTGESNESGILTVSVGNSFSTDVLFRITEPASTPSTSLTLDLSLSNANSGAPTSTINAVEPGIVTATITDSVTGTPVDGQLVLFQIITGDPTITPDSGEVLTRGGVGEAELRVAVGNSQPGAAIRIFAEVDVDDDGLPDLTETIAFSVGSADIALGFESDGSYISLEDIANNLNQIGVGNGTSSITDLSATGTAQLDVGVYNVATGELVTTPVTVNFAISGCPLTSTASVDTNVTTINGVARATFAAAADCGAVTVTASLAELGGANATGSITIAETATNSIRFVEANPALLVLAGTGGTETARVVFEVVDNTGLAKPDQLVSFSLSTAVGGLSLDSLSASSNSQGRVTAVVNAGAVPTTVQVIATVDLGGGETVSTVSNSLVVSTGLPDQDSFSLSATRLNPGGGDFDGITSDLIIRAADAFNNPVPDGTAVVFTTEYGQIGSQCTTVDGSCTVTWTSASPRTPLLPGTGTVRTLIADNLTGCPPEYAGVPRPAPCRNVDSFPQQQVYSGRTTILAHTLGEESFVDANGSGLYDWIDLNNNGQYDVGEPLEVFQDLPEAFVDHNEDGAFGNNLTPGSCATDPDAGTNCAGYLAGGDEDEHVETFPGGLAGDGRYNAGNGIYNGRLCHPQLAALDLCTTDPILVRDSLTIVMGGRTPYISLREAGTRAQFGGVADLSGGGSETIVAYISDFQNGRLPGGTTINITNDNCRVAGLSSYTIPDTSAPGFTEFAITLTPDDTLGETGTVNVTVTTPESVGGGDTRTATFTCID